jgi:hypothetical protein
MSQLPEYVDGLPNICGSEPLVEETLRASRVSPVFLPESRIDFGHIRSACAIALHMHQPLIPAGGGGDYHTAAVISNLKYMIGITKALVITIMLRLFHWCYKRIGEFVPQLINEGKEPRVMLEYSGTLFHGLRAMGLHDVFDALKNATCNPAVPARALNGWVVHGGHAVAPSTPAQDFRLHVKAWQHHFAAIFGLEALARVRGFSPSEMALPNHPDIAYEYIKTLGGLRLSMGAGARAHGGAAGKWSWGSGEETPAASADLYQLQRRDRQYHCPHQDAGQRHQAGGADAALLRSQEPVALGTGGGNRCRRW